MGDQLEALFTQAQGGFSLVLLRNVLESTLHAQGPVVPVAHGLSNDAQPQHRFRRKLYQHFGVNGLAVPHAGMEGLLQSAAVGLLHQVQRLLCRPDLVRQAVGRRDVLRPRQLLVGQFDGPAPYLGHVPGHAQGFGLFQQTHAGVLALVRHRRELLLLLVQFDVCQRQTGQCLQRLQWVGRGAALTGVHHCQCAQGLPFAVYQWSAGIKTDTGRPLNQRVLAEHWMLCGVLHHDCSAFVLCAVGAERLQQVGMRG